MAVHAACLNWAVYIALLLSSQIRNLACIWHCNSSRQDAELCWRMDIGAFTKFPVHYGTSSGGMGLRTVLHDFQVFACTCHMQREFGSGLHSGRMLEAIGNQSHGKPCWLQTDLKEVDLPRKCYPHHLTAWGYSVHMFLILLRNVEAATCHEE